MFFKNTFVHMHFWDSYIVSILLSEAILMGSGGKRLDDNDNILESHKSSRKNDPLNDSLRGEKCSLKLNIGTMLI